MSKIIKTDLCLTVTCKCGSCVAATLLYGGVDIDSDFIDTIAKIYLDGGKIELIKTSEKKVSLAECICKKEPKIKEDKEQLQLF